jgi:hypothetical protein
MCLRCKNSAVKFGRIYTREIYRFCKALFGSRTPAFNGAEQHSSVISWLIYLCRDRSTLNLSLWLYQAEPLSMRNKKCFDEKAVDQTSLNALLKLACLETSMQVQERTLKEMLGRPCGLWTGWCTVRVHFGEHWITADFGTRVFCV